MVTAQAVKLSALVAAAVSAGYLWRAALDNGPEQVLATAPPAIHFDPGADLFNSLTGLQAEAARVARQEALKAERARIAGLSEAGLRSIRLRGAADRLRPDGACSLVVARLRVDGIRGIESRQVAEAKTEAEAPARSWWTEPAAAASAAATGSAARSRRQDRRLLHRPHRLRSAAAADPVGARATETTHTAGLRASAESPRLAPTAAKTRASKGTTTTRATRSSTGTAGAAATTSTSPR